MATLFEAIRLLLPGVDFADVDGTLENVRIDTPDVGKPTQEQVESALLTLAKREHAVAAGVEFDARVAAGVAYGGKVLQIGDDDRANITGQSSRAIASMLSGSGVTWPSDFAWRMADNSSLALPTAADMLALGQAAADRYAALRLKLGQIKDAIDAAADQAALDAIDVTAGWD
jgi:hypothetical protein